MSRLGQDARHDKIYDEELLLAFEQCLKDVRFGVLLNSIQHLNADGCRRYFENTSSSIMCREYVAREPHRITLYL